MAKCKFCSKESPGSCPDCGAPIYTIGATIVWGTTIDDASACEVTVTRKYLFIRRVSKSEKRKATAGRAFGLVGMIVAEAATDKSNEFGWYPLSDFSKIIYPYATKKSSHGIKLIAKDGRDLVLIFNSPDAFDSFRKAAKTVAKHLGAVLPVEDGKGKFFGLKGCQKPYATEENFDKIRPSRTASKSAPSMEAVLSELHSVLATASEKKSAQPAPAAAPVRKNPQPAPAAVPEWKRTQADPVEKTVSSEETFRCTNCGTVVAATNKFCIECGTKREKEKKCLRCGKVLTQNEKFCGECGYKVNR